jgi:hypothetical protein
MFDPVAVVFATPENKLSHPPSHSLSLFLPPSLTLSPPPIHPPPPSLPSSLPSYHSMMQQLFMRFPKSFFVLTAGQIMLYLFLCGISSFLMLYLGFSVYYIFSYAISRVFPILCFKKYILTEV